MVVDAIGVVCGHRGRAGRSCGTLLAGTWKPAQEWLTNCASSAFEGIAGAAFCDSAGFTSPCVGRPGRSTRNDSRDSHPRGGTDPIADVAITVVAKGSLAATGFTAQQVLNAVARGAAVNPELVQRAQDATRGGPQGTI